LRNWAVRRHFLPLTFPLSIQGKLPIIAQAGSLLSPTRILVQSADIQYSTFGLYISHYSNTFVKQFPRIGNSCYDYLEKLVEIDSFQAKKPAFKQSVRLQVNHIRAKFRKTSTRQDFKDISPFRLVRVVLKPLNISSKYIQVKTSDTTNNCHRVFLGRLELMIWPHSIGSEEQRAVQQYRYTPGLDLGI